MKKMIFWEGQGWYRLSESSVYYKLTEEERIKFLGNKLGSTPVFFRRRPDPKEIVHLKGVRYK